MNLPRVVLKKGKDRPLKRNHPWIFSGAVAHKSDGLLPGTWVEVTDHQENILALGHYNGGSIAVHVLHFGNFVDTSGIYQNALSHAVQWRAMWGYPNANTNAFRLVHAESDGIPGLVIDVYNGHVVMQGYTPGIDTDHQLIADALRAVYKGQLHSVTYKYSKAHESPQGAIEYVWGELNDPVEISENGMAFWVAISSGQKTGFFLDQRNSRALCARLAAGKNVLNAFSYTAGFSVSALKGGAKHVLSVDSSAEALELGQQNIALNGFKEKNDCVEADAMEYLRDHPPVDYDLVIIDPPAFAKSPRRRHKAVQAYKRLNAAALKTMASGSMLMTFSCSQVVDQALFVHTIAAAAYDSKRNVKILKQLHQPEDHPVSLSHPESEYLKGLLLAVE